MLAEHEGPANFMEKGFDMNYKKDPTKSLIYDMKAENEKQFMSGNTQGTDFGKFTTRHTVMVFFFLAFVVMVYGVIPWRTWELLCQPGGGGSRK